MAKGTDSIGLVSNHSAHLYVGLSSRSPGCSLSKLEPRGDPGEKQVIHPEAPKKPAHLRTLGGHVASTQTLRSQLLVPQNPRDLRVRPLLNGGSRVASGQTMETARQTRPAPRTNSRSRGRNRAHGHVTCRHPRGSRVR